jgi:A118 family predicted phage portal protein
MPLPTRADTAWPPREWRAVQDDLDEAAVWYAGDPDRLHAFYAARRSNGDNRPSRRRFWGRATPGTGERSPRTVHVPAAADVAATSADLLFGEPPVITVAEAHRNTDASTTGDTEAKAAEDRLSELDEKLGLANTILEGAEIAAALGGVYLRVGWDQEAAPTNPLLTVVHADMAIPEFRYGVMTAVTIWRVIEEDGSKIVRHLERHEGTTIEHAVFIGDPRLLGARSPLNAHAATKGLTDLVQVPAGVEGLLVRYVPNVLPNRKHRNRPVGRGDTMGAESLMDGLDMTYSSWMRDIDLGKARIVVPNDWLTRPGRGEGAQFDIDRDVFTGLPGVDPSSDNGPKITPIEFKIRTDEHAATAMALWEKIISNGGYSGQTFGLDGEGGAATATEVRARQAKSMRTRARKERYWAPQLADTLVNLLAVDKALFNGKAAPIRPTVDLRDGIEQPLSEVAETVQLLKNAQAASVRTRVRMAQPDLDGPELEAEVKAILAEEALAVPDPTGFTSAEHTSENDEQE